MKQNETTGSNEYRRDYYKDANGNDLFSKFEGGMMTHDNTVGFYLGNVYKYVTRFGRKTGTEDDDLHKALTYLTQLAGMNHDETDMSTIFKAKSHVENVWTELMIKSNRTDIHGWHVDYDALTIQVRKRIMHWLSCYQKGMHDYTSDFNNYLYDVSLLLDKFIDYRSVVVPSN